MAIISSTIINNCLLSLATAFRKYQHSRLYKVCAS